MPDYTIAQRTTVPLRLQFLDTATPPNAIPIPEKFVSAKAAIGLTAKTSSADDVALDVDLSRRDEGIAEIVLTDEVTGSLVPGKEYTVDCLMETADGERERPMKITVIADRTRTL